MNHSGGQSVSRISPSSVIIASAARHTQNHLLLFISHRCASLSLLLILPAITANIEILGKIKCDFERPGQDEMPF